MIDIVLNRRILITLIPALEKSPDEAANLGKIVAATIKGMMGSTLGATVEALDDSETGIDVDAATSAAVGVGSILRVDSERMLVTERQQLDTGQTVLIVGATGGVGQALVQLAALTGAKVIATARDDMTGTIRRLGADETVDHSQGDLNDQVLRLHGDGIDAILDVASDTQGAERLAQLLRPGGTYISTTWSVNPDAMEAQGHRGVNHVGAPSAELLDRLSDLIDAGKLRVMIEREVPLEAAGDALGLNLLGNPWLVQNDAAVAWKTALWYWNTQTGPGTMTGHNAMVNGAGFGHTIRSINGSLECDGKNPAQVQSRVSAYQRFVQILGTSAGGNLYC